MNQKQKRNQTSKIVYAGLLLVALGVALPLVGFSLPAPLETVGNIPYSPYIPENYYSRGIVDYVNSETGNYYLVIMPKSTKNVNYDRTVASASITFEEASVTLDVPFRRKVQPPEDITGYEWSQFWLETDVVSDGLQFDMNYTITWEVVDVYGRTASVSDWLMFKSVADGGDAPFVEPQAFAVGSVFNYLTIGGVAMVAAGLWLGRKKR